MYECITLSNHHPDMSDAGRDGGLALVLALVVGPERLPNAARVVVLGDGALRDDGNGLAVVEALLVARQVVVLEPGREERFVSSKGV